MGKRSSNERQADRPYSNGNGRACFLKHDHQAGFGAEAASAGSHQATECGQRAPELTTPVHDINDSDDRPYSNGSGRACSLEHDH